MTYEEALQCEEHAKESLKEFPMEVRENCIILFTLKVHFHNEFGFSVADTNSVFGQ